MTLRLIILCRVDHKSNFLTLSQNSWTRFLHALTAPDVLVESFSKRFTSSSPIRVPLSGGAPSFSLAREPNLVESMMMMRWMHLGPECHCTFLLDAVMSRIRNSSGALMRLNHTRTFYDARP